MLLLFRQENFSLHYISVNSCARLLGLYNFNSYNAADAMFYLFIIVIYFWATVCKTVRPMLSDRCLSCPAVSCL